MEKLKKFFINLLIIAYAVIAISVTVLLLSYNDYHVSVLGDYSFVLVTDDELEDFGYEAGSLVIVKAEKAKNIDTGDGIFFYRTISTSEFEINYGNVVLKDNSTGINNPSYIVEGGVVIKHEYVIGSTEDIKVIPHLGTILSILESRYGYLFLIVVVSFIAFLYEIYELIMEIKYGEREEDEEDYDDDDDYDDEYEDDEYEDEYEDEEEEEVVVRPRKTAKKATTSTAKKVAATKTTKAATTKKTSTGSTAKKATVAKQATAKTTTAKKPTATKTATAKKATTAAKSTATKKTTATKSATKATTTKTTTAKKTSTAKKAESK